VEPFNVSFSQIYCFLRNMYFGTSIVIPVVVLHVNENLIEFLNELFCNILDPAISQGMIGCLNICDEHFLYVT